MRTARLVLLVALIAASPSDELARLIQELAIQPGMSVADIGAGEGKQSLEMARYVGSQGHLFSTDINTGALRKIKDDAVKQGLENLTTVEGHATRTNLPDECCDAIFIRNTYHHFDDPSAMNASIRQALKPGGRLAVIDFPPSDRKPNVPGKRALNASHGVIAPLVVEELRTAGFEVLHTIDHWTEGDSKEAYYAVIARKPGETRGSPEGLRCNSRLRGVVVPRGRIELPTP